MRSNSRYNRIILYNEKKSKKLTKTTREIDLEDLESYANWTNHTEFSNIASINVAKKTILEWFSIDGISFWWFVQGTIYPKYNEGIIFIERLESFLKHNFTNEFKISGNFDKISLVKQICNQKNIKFKIVYRQYFLFLIKNSLTKLVKGFAFKKITHQKKKKRIKQFSSLINKIHEPPIGYTLLTSISRRIKSNTEQNITNSEYILQPIIDELSKNKIDLCCFDCDYSFKGETKILSERLNGLLNWAPLEILTKNSKSDRTKSSTDQLKNRIYQNIEPLSEVFSYKNISLSKFMKPILKEIFYEPYIPYYFQLIENIEEFLVKNKPRTIIQDYETGPYAKAFVVVAKKLGIRTIAIQHATIQKDNANYMMKELQNEENPLGNVISDLTLVFGEHEKKILKDIGYPENQIDVIGNSRFSNFENIKNRLNHDNILTKYNIPNKKIILIGLSNHISKNSFNEDFELLNYLYSSFKDNQEFVFLIRIHPGDNLELATKILEQKYFGHNFKISSGTLFEDFFISSVIITIHSSLGIEAPFFEKPVFIPIISKYSFKLNPLYEDLVDKKLGFVLSKSELIQKLLLDIPDSQWKLESSKQRKEFLKNCFNYGNSVDLMKLIYN